MAPPLGIIITVSVLVAAGIACYENPHVREWIDQSRRKIAVALHSLGDEVAPRPPKRPRWDDPSMREDDSEEAAEKRRQARQEILERGKILEEKRRKSVNSETVNPSQSFDTLVDKDGSLLQPKAGPETQQQQATTTATELQSQDGLLTRRHEPPSGQPVDLLAQLESNMQSTFQMGPLRRRSSDASSATLSESHASASLINLTPASTVPDRDPNISTPASDRDHPDLLSRTEYFSPAASVSLSHTLSPAPPALAAVSTSSSVSEDSNYYYAHPSNPNPNPFADPISPSPSAQLRSQLLQRHEMASPSPQPPSSAPSIVGSEMEHIYVEDGDGDTDTDNGVLSEFEDGIRTPGSVWTEVESVVSEQ